MKTNQGTAAKKGQVVAGSNNLATRPRPNKKRNPTPANEWRRSVDGWEFRKPCGCGHPAVRRMVCFRKLLSFIGQGRRGRTGGAGPRGPRPPPPHTHTHSTQVKREKRNGVWARDQLVGEGPGSRRRRRRRRRELFVSSQRPKRKVKKKRERRR